MERLQSPGQWCHCCHLVQPWLRGIPGTEMGSRSAQSLWVLQVVPNWVTRGKQNNRLGCSQGKDLGALGTLLIFSQDNVEMELHGIPSTKMGSSTIPSFSSREPLWVLQLLPNWLTRGKQQKNRLGWRPRIMARTVIRRSLRSLSPQTIPEFHQQFPDPCGSNSGHPAQASHSSTWKRFHGESSWLTGIL